MSACAHRDQVNFSRPKFLDGVELVSVAYRDRAFPTHTHDCFVVGTVVAGAEELDVWGSRRVVSVGDVIQLNPDQPHSNRTVGSETLKYRVFYLSPASVSKSTNPGGSRTLSFGLPVVSDSRLALRLANIHAFLSDEPADRLAQENAMMMLLHDLVQKEQGPARQSRAGSIPIRRACAWIEEHFAESFGLTELASVAGLSAFRLAHLFKESIGLSPIAYRNQRRIAEARRLLRDGKPIAQIALQLGFADQSHLTRQFQRIVGLSPERYRQQ